VSASQNANPIRLVVLLYEQLIKDIQRAATAQSEGNIEARSREVDHALVVVGHLQASLDMEHGGEVARNLDRFYRCIATSLLDAGAKASQESMHQLVDHVVALRQAWVDVERSVAIPSAAPVNSSPAFDSAPATEPSSPTRGSWKI